MTNKPESVLYIGVTSDLVTRIFQHKQKALPKSFSGKYNLDKLVHYEEFGCMEEAILREKKLKKFKREWKDNLIEGQNPNWEDLTGNILGIHHEIPGLREGANPRMTN